MFVFDGGEGEGGKKKTYKHYTDGRKKIRPEITRKMVILQGKKEYR